MRITGRIDIPLRQNPRREKGTEAVADGREIAWSVTNAVQAGEIKKADAEYYLEQHAEMWAERTFGAKTYRDQCNVEGGPVNSRYWAAHSVAHDILTKRGYIKKRSNPPSTALGRKAERGDIVEFYDSVGNAHDGKVTANGGGTLSVLVHGRLMHVPYAMVTARRATPGFNAWHRMASRRPYRRNPFKRRTRGKRSKQVISSRPSKRTRYKRTEVPMAKRRRRNSPITAKQAGVLRSILSAHGYRVGKKRRKVRRKAKRSAHRRVARKVKAPKRLRSGTTFKRRGRKYVVVSRIVRVNGRKIRIRYARKR